uniref:Proteasome inhibitor PI31 subunit n=1 Tax=Corethrella appendiculata TaxID=1370023 RepID=U5EX73_9DIPT
MSLNTDFGWQLLFKTIENDIHNKSDILVAVIHWNLLRNAFLNCGIGDDKTLKEEDEKSELLPDGWNVNSKSYALRYINAGELYTLHANCSDNDTIIVNLLQVKSLNVSNIAFTIGETVKQLQGKKLINFVPEIQTVQDRLRKELLEPVFNGNKKDSDTQTTAVVKPKFDILTDGSRARSRFGVPLQGNDFPGLRDIGRGDLDPLGRGGGGMLFQPPAGFNPLHMPGRGGGSGLIPPGARFDPFNTPGVSRANPNPDHLPPPGFDDMFM